MAEHERDDQIGDGPRETAAAGLGAGSESGPEAPRRGTPRRKLLRGLVLTAAGTVAGAGRAGAQGGPDAGAGTFQPHPEIPGAPAVLPVQPAGVAFVSIPAYAFQPRNSTQLYAPENPYSGAIYQSGGALDYFWAPVHLPHGARIVSCAFYLVSNNANSAGVTLSYFEQAIGGLSGIASGTSAPNVAAIQTVVPPVTPHLVNNAVETYLVGWRPGSAAITHCLYGARVGYTFSVSLPAMVR